MSDLRRSHHQKSRSWGSFNRQARLAKQQVSSGGNNNVQESNRKASTKTPNNHRSKDTPPRMTTRRKSEGDRRTFTTTTTKAIHHHAKSPKCLPGLGGRGGHSPSPRTVMRPSTIFCPSSQKEQKFVPLDDDTFSTIARPDPKPNLTTSKEHYSQIWLSNYNHKGEEYAKKKWGVSARKRTDERIASERKEPEEESNSKEDLPRRKLHSRTSSKRTSIIEREIEQLAKALHQVPSAYKSAEQHHRQDLSVTFHESPFASAAKNDDPALSTTDFPFSDDFDVFGDSSNKDTTVENDFDTMKKGSERGLATSPQFRRRTFAEKEISFEEALNRREQVVPPNRSLPIKDKEETILDTTGYTITPSIFRAKVWDGEIHSIYDGDCHEEKKESDGAPGIQGTKLNIRNQALFRPEDLDFYRHWTIQQPDLESSLGECTFDEHLAQLKLDGQEDGYHEPVLGCDEIVLQQSTFSKDESNLISEITETFSSEGYLNHITRERESILQQNENENACRKAKCYVFYNKPFSNKNEEKSSEKVPAHVKGVVKRLGSLNRLEADFAEEFGYKDFIPIQDQKEKEANLRLGLSNGSVEDAFTDGDEALHFMNSQSFSFENESTVNISSVD